MKAIAHITRMTKWEWTKRSGLFRLLGADFMIDENLKVWFIEVNFFPMLFRTRPDVWKWTTDLIKDMIEIEYGLLKSRMTRVSKFMRSYIKTCMLEESNCDKKVWQEMFFKINKEEMDPQFAPRPDNGWRLIVDESKPGKEAYMGLLDASCFEGEN